MEGKYFKLGWVVSTRTVSTKAERDSLFRDFIKKSVERYSNCDWGNTCDEDAKLNDEAVKNREGRIFAEYIMEKSNERIWVITEEDRSVTTILFPSEY